MKVVEAFSLDSERDADIISALDRAENKSSLFREAMRVFLGKQTSIADDLAEIKQMLLSGITLQSQEKSQDRGNDLLDEAMAKLDKIGM